MRTLLSATLCLGTLAAARVARADDSINSGTVGVVLSIPVAGSFDAWGLGVNASVMHFPDDDRLLGVGGFVQAQYLFGGGWRLATGVQPAAYAVGAELGVAVGAAPGGTVDLALHLAPYLSIGYVTAGVRYTLPRSTPGYGLSVVAGANVWWLFERDVVYEPYRLQIFEPVPGRPLVVEGRPRVAEATRDDAWCGPRDGACREALSDDARAALAAAWTQAMLDEHASVAAFARASLELVALGAPPELVARVHRAALDEVDHARRCAALAQRFAGEPVSPGPLPQAAAALGARDLAAVAVATLREGCLGEAVAARLAATSRDEATDAEVREALEVIARDEAAHGELAWDIVRWCVARGGAAVRDAVATALREAPAGVRAGGDARGALEGFGVPSPRAKARAWTHARRAGMRRWHRLARAA